MFFFFFCFFFVCFVLHFGKYSTLSIEAIMYCSDIIYNCYNSNENIFKIITFCSNYIMARYILKDAVDSPFKIAYSDNNLDNNNVNMYVIIVTGIVVYLMSVYYRNLTRFNR